MNTSETIKTELAQLERHISFGNGSEAANDVSSKAKIWIQIFGELSPKKVYETLEKNFEQLHIRLPANQPYPGFSVPVELVHSSAGNILRTVFSITVPAQRAHEIFISNIDIMVGKKGAGLGTVALSNMATLARTCLPNLRTLAACWTKSGSYFAARAGFTPLKGAWNALRDELALRKDALAPHLSAEDNATFNAVIASNDPTSIWTLAEKDTPLHFSHGSENTLGKYCLVGRTWVGALELQNPRAMEKLTQSATRMLARMQASSVEKS
jgi:hypothetical protein